MSLPIKLTHMKIYFCIIIVIKIKREDISMNIYTANKGDTIEKIAAEYGVSKKLLLEINGLTDDEELISGQNILILFPESTHKVKRGETLYSIAVSYGVTVKQLLRNNPQYIGLPFLSEGDEVILSFNEEKWGTAEINGYVYPYVSEEILNMSLPYMTYLSPFTYGITSGGGLVPLNDDGLLRDARDFSVMPLMHLSTLTEEGVFSNELASVVLSSPDIQEKLILSVKNTISQKGYGGLDIDFEYVLPAESLLYAEFVEKLRNELNPLSKKVFTALAPKTSDNQRGTLYEGHNYSRLGAASDGALLMTYEWGYTYGPPMAVAPINAVENVLKYAVSRIPPEKIFLGIPNYGYDWTLPYVKGESRAVSLSNPEAVDIARRAGVGILFDETAMSPHFNYTAEDGRKHEVWFEDAKSILEKLELIKNYSLKGAGYWNLMRPFQPNWSLLNAVFDIYGF